VQNKCYKTALKTIEYPILSLQMLIDYSLLTKLSK